MDSNDVNCIFFFFSIIDLYNFIDLTKYKEINAIPAKVIPRYKRKESKSNWRANIEDKSKRRGINKMSNVKKKKKLREKWSIIRQEYVRNRENPAKM